MQRCRSPRDEGVLAVSSVTYGALQNVLWLIDTFAFVRLFGDNNRTCRTTTDMNINESRDDDERYRLTLSVLWQNGWGSGGASLNGYCCGCCKEASPTQLAIVLDARLDVAPAQYGTYAALVTDIRLNDQKNYWNLCRMDTSDVNKTKFLRPRPRPK